MEGSATAIHIVLQAALFISENALAQEYRHNARDMSYRAAESIARAGALWVNEAHCTCPITQRC
jgi:hypothetical protein